MLGPPTSYTCPTPTESGKCIKKGKHFYSIKEKKKRKNISTYYFF